MFIVAMTLAVLASLGVYALAAASMEVRTSGNERQSTQTHYLAEYGVVSATFELTSTRSQWYLGTMQSTPDSSCVSLPGVPSTVDPASRACWRMGSSEIAKTTTGGKWAAAAIDNSYQDKPLETNNAPGSFGPVPMQGDFFVELTEPLQVPATRNSLNLHLCFVNFTVTSTGLTNPYYASLDPTGSYGGEGVEVQRARVVAGPILCPK